VVLVRHILDAARSRLAVLSSEALVCDAARVLANRNTPLIVVCDRGSNAVGVMSRSDIIRLLASAGTDVYCTSAAAIMTQPFVSCQVDQPLQQVWTIMSARSLRCAPVLDDEGRPQGIVHARDLALALLDEVTHEEELLRDYVLGVGYR
jgi:CBS domain-containing protein